MTPQPKNPPIWQAISTLLKNEADKLTPGDVARMTIQTMGNFALKIPDDVWAEVMESSTKPCSTEGCDCEKARGPMMAALDTVRSYARSKVAVARGEKGFAE